MAAGNACWGIEIGAYAIKALKLERDGDEVKVLDYAVVPHPKVLSEPGVDESDVLRVSLGTFASQTDLSGASIAVSVPGHSSFARFAKLPPVEPKKVPDIVKFEAVQQIPFSLDEVEWDFQTFQSEESPDIEVGIFAITRDRIQKQLDLLADVGLVPDVVTLSPVAVYNSLAYDLGFTPTTAGTIIVDVGTTSTDLVIADAGRVWVRTFPLGGHQFTDALVNAFKISYPKAEKLKREAEQSKHARHVFQAMRPVFTDLVQDVQRSVGYYQSLHPEAKLTRLIGLGSTFKLPGLRKYLKQQLQLDVYRMEAYKRLSVDGTHGGEFQTVSLNVATAYGLALQGLGMQTISANLMPVKVLRTAMWKRKVKWFGIAAGLGVAAAGAMIIRPMLDSSAVASSPKPPMIARAIADYNRAKQEAQDVTTQPETDYTAAEMVKLVEDRGVYAHIIDDVAVMLADAQQKATLWNEANENKLDLSQPIMVLSSLKTTYQGPSEEDMEDSGSQSSFGEPADTEGSEGGEPVSVDIYAGKPRITVDLIIRTTHPDPQTFVLNSIDDWITLNAKRDGMPYHIVVDDNYFVVGAAVDPGRAGPAAGIGRPAPPVTGRDTRGGRGRQPIDVQRGGQTSPPGRTASGGNIDQLAPLKRPEELESKPGTEITLTIPLVLIGDPPEQVQGEELP